MAVGTRFVGHLLEARKTARLKKFATEKSTCFENVHIA
jgi:hypothetical protein